MDLVGELTQVVGEPNVITDQDAMTPYLTDWTGKFRGSAIAVVSPATTAQVAQVMRISQAHQVSVQPQGGNTSLVGGGIPGRDAHPGIVLRTHRLDWIADPDDRGATVTAGAGATLAAIQRAARTVGRNYGVDIAARSSATIGGTVATNAGGIRVCAFGMTREQVLGLEVVLPDGRVVSHMRGLEKDNTGLRWDDIFIGSEGTLGVITAVTVKLRSAITESALLLVGCDSIEEVLQLVDDMAQSHQLLAAELMEARGVAIVEKFADLPRMSIRESFYVLIEVVGTDVDSNLIGERDAILATDAEDGRRLWRLRELQSEAAALMAQAFGVRITKLDVTLPLANLATFHDGYRRLLAATDGVHDNYCFGHVADGNLHIEIAADPGVADLVTRTVLEQVAQLGGSISAEHGIGRAKAHFLHLSRSSDEIALMRQLKKSLDPAGLMAPGVIFTSGDADD